MNSVDRVKKICKDRKIPISKLERELGFSNGYISQLRKGVFPADRLVLIADYLQVSADFLMTGIDSDGLTEKDNRDIAKDMESIRTKLLNGAEVLKIRHYLFYHSDQPFFHSSCICKLLNISIRSRSHHRLNI